MGDDRGGILHATRARHQHENHHSTLANARTRCHSPSACLGPAGSEWALSDPLVFAAEPQAQPGQPLGYN